MKGSKREAHLLSPSIGEVKNEWNHTSTLLCDCMGCVLKTVPCILREEFHSFCNFMLSVYVKIVNIPVFLSMFL